MEMKCGSSNMVQLVSCAYSHSTFSQKKNRQSGCLLVKLLNTTVMSCGCLV